MANTSTSGRLRLPSDLSFDASFPKIRVKHSQANGIVSSIRNLEFGCEIPLRLQSVLDDWRRLLLSSIHQLSIGVGFSQYISIFKAPGLYDRDNRCTIGYTSIGKKSMHAVGVSRSFSPRVWIKRINSASSSSH